MDGRGHQLGTLRASDGAASTVPYNDMAVENEALESTVWRDERDAMSEVDELLKGQPYSQTRE